MNPKLSIITVTKNRPQQLIESAYQSLEKQGNRHFEWIVINDGGDGETRENIARLKPDFPIVYIDLECPQTGFRLCYGRDRGLELARGELVTYLDDDNRFKPDFVAKMLSISLELPQIKFFAPLQHRCRNIIEGGEIIKEGKPFISPLATTTTAELIEQKQLFDSNGFTHYRIDAPKWNPNYRIYCDYEYFLQCLNVWGKEKFALLPGILVDYVQTNKGVIGQSNYNDWVLELEKIIEDYYKYSALTLNPNHLESLRQLKQKFIEKQESRKIPEAFVVSEKR